MKTIQDDRECILEMRKQGIPVTQIEIETGWHMATIYKLLREVEGNKSPRFPKDRYEDVKRMWEDGHSCSTIGKHFNISHKTVSRILKTFNIQVPKATDWSKYAWDHADEIVEKWEEGGLTIQTLCKEYNVSEPTMKKIFTSKGKTNLLRHRGDKNPAWKGGRYIGKQGYVVLWADPNHPFFETMALGQNKKHFLEHRVVMAEHLGRPLTSKETVHHKNGNRSDNRIENLELRQGSHGSGQKWCCADCGSPNIVATALN